MSRARSIRNGRRAGLRRLAGPVVLLALLTGLAARPALAVRTNILTKPGTVGLLRVRPIGALKTGELALQHGDGTYEQDPNRTTGDVEPPSPLGNGPACNGFPTPDDCYRSLAVNDPQLNPSASDGHTHYHAGDQYLIVNEVKGFRAGDTVMIGSPYCNMPYLGPTCERYIPGTGYIDEQPTGETASIVGGDVSVDDHGPGVLQLSEGLKRQHLDGEQVIKLPTAYVGQDLRLEVPNAALFPDITVAPPLELKATFIPPQGSRFPWDPAFRRPLATGPREPRAFSAIVTAPEAATTFFISRETTHTATVGSTFDYHSDDSWYSVEVTATDVTGRVVADGMLRFKLNPVVFASLVPSPPLAIPGQAVVTVGELRDASSPAALSRRVEDVDIDVNITGPSLKSWRLKSCYDVTPGSVDECRGDPNDPSRNMHGNFFVTMGGFFCLPTLEAVGNCRAGNHMQETLRPGTYTVTAIAHLSSPDVRITTTFVVAVPS